jgi:microcin C transport system substrate-binding protein
MDLTRRSILKIKLAAACSLALPSGSNAAISSDVKGIETYGLSPFEHLKLPADFKNFPYVNPDAPKGGTLVMLPRRPHGNQNLNTFNTLNIFVLKGDGAVGVESTFDSLMVESLDERNSFYGLVARAVRISADRLTYRFLLRPEARFHDGSNITAKDVVFSLNAIRLHGHPTYQTLLTELTAVEAVDDYTVEVKIASRDSRDVPLVVAMLPIFSLEYWSARDFEAATLEPILGSGPYKIAQFEPGRFIELERASDYWAMNLPVNIGLNNFDRVRYEYFRDRQVAFEAFKAGEMNFYEDLDPRNWATGYDIPAVNAGRIKREEVVSRGITPIAGWFFNTRRSKFADVRIRKAIGLAFNFEWTDKYVMYSAYQRIVSYFQNTDMEAVGKASKDEIVLLRPFLASLPSDIFEDAVLPPTSDDSGVDRAQLERAAGLLRTAGCTLKGSVLHLQDGSPFEFEFLNSSNAYEAQTGPFISNLSKLGISAEYRTVDPVQFAYRRDTFEFDVLPMVYLGSLTPGPELEAIYGSVAASTFGSRNVAGIRDLAVDALIDRIASANSRNELNVTCRALDRVLRANYYWVPMWYREKIHFSYWDVFSRPRDEPQFGLAAPATWWWDARKAQAIKAPG